MNKKNIFRNISLLAISTLITLTGCKDENNVTPPSGELLLGSTRTLNESSLISGKIRVKFTREVGNNITTQVNGESISRCGISQIDQCLDKVGAISMKRVFPYAGKFEERTRREGLHLWYDIEFDKSTSVLKVANEFRQIEGVDIVEERYQVAVPTAQVVYVDNIPQQSATGYFNDPQLSDQWHYENKGATPKSVVGADINLVNAWKIESGKNNVIVSVVDGGIDYDHEDIIDNMWINEAELNGTEGVDDDGNGIVDDVYGYNFVSNSGTITADDHGTHVAGTVAARNNNGKGVCGVAGGNGDEDSGVRLMSCQVFEDQSSGGNSAAIKYGADNGAVISQNSWGYKYPGPSSLPPSDKEAIDYFIKHAGCDNDGNQLPDSPMKGGVVIFAAGNDNADFKAYPAAYSEVISVSAMAPDFKKASYTNRGDWITIMAPGGDRAYSKGQILSTYPNDKYGYMPGTSMACPHVSGVAALIVSKFGKKGFTNEDLKKRLKSSLRPYNIDEKNPGYEGKLGAGYIDAEKALAENKNMKPANVTDAKVEPSYDYVNVTFTAVKDNDDGTALFYLLYYSKDQLNASNLTSAKVAKVKGMAAKAGEKITYKLTGLDLNSNYNFALVAEDRWGLVSEKPYFFKGKTLENLAPKVSIVNERVIRVTETEKENVEILVEEPEGQSWRFSLEGDKSGVTANKTSKGITLTFAAKAPFGQYKVKVKVLDIFNAEASVEIPFEIYKNNAPQLVKEFDKIFAPIGQDVSVDLTQYFKEPDGHTIKYEISSDNKSVVNVTLSETNLKITPSMLGSGTITINASDIHGAKTTTRFDVQVVKNELVYIAYPIPVETDFFVRLNDKITNSTVKILTTTGSVVFEKNYTTNTPDERLLKLDLSKVSGGTYVLSVEANGENYKKSFIKL